MGAVDGHVDTEFDVVNHITEEPTGERRNVLIEAARITRGKIKDVRDVSADELDALVAPVGGGGLMSGSCITMHAMSSATKLIGAEPVGADDAARSLEAGDLKLKNGLISQTAHHTRRTHRQIRIP